MLSINTNITSLLAMTSLSKNTGAMNTALNRLSTGYRINSTKDDAAGSAISASLNKEISSFEVAQDNAQMGQSMIDVATNTLNNLQGMVQRIRDLAEESANGTYGYEERRAMQNEVNSLVDEIYRIKETTVFNGKKIFGEESSRIESPKALSEAEARAQGYTVVKTAQELKEALKSGDANCKVMLFSDIDLNDLGFDETGSNWTAVGDEAESFNGIFDGNDFIISNLTMNDTDPDKKRQSLIGSAEGATIKNVIMENVNLNFKSNSIGGIVGYADGTTIENVDVTGSIQSSNSYIGGIAGYVVNNSEINNCSFSGTVNNYMYTGGIAGYTKDSTIKNTDVTASITGRSYSTAGITGYGSNSTIENCNVSGDITGRENTGGIVANDYGSTIQNCNVSADITASYRYTGGIVGNDNGSIIQNCNVSADITASGMSTGGISGQKHYGTIENCTATGSISGTQYTGGVVGRFTTNDDTKVINTKTTCEVTSTINSPGAVIGLLNSLKGSYSGNEYNSTINGEDVKTVGIGRQLTEAQCSDNPDLVIKPEKPQAKINSVRLQVGTGYDDNSVIELDTGFKLDDFNVNIKTESKASQSISKIDEVMESLITKQTELGAVSNRIKSTIEFQQVQKDSKIAMLSVVKDADMAKESSNFIKSQILQQTTASLLAQANQTPSIALRLLSI